MNNKKIVSPAAAIFKSGITAGSLDILGAIIVHAFIFQKVTAIQVLQSVASGVYGKEAFRGGWSMAAAGLFFHFVIAFCFAAGYFVVYPHIPLFRKQPVVSGLLYGIFAWALMQFAIVPLSNAGMGPLTARSAFIGIGILMVCLGLPIALITHRYYSSIKGAK